MKGLSAYSRRLANNVDGIHIGDLTKKESVTQRDSEANCSCSS